MTKGTHKPTSQITGREVWRKEWPARHVFELESTCTAPTAIHAHRDRLSFDQVSELLGISISPLEVRIEAIEARLDQQSFIVPIQSLAPRPIAVTQPLMAVVHTDDDCYVASFYDANINASGESELDATEMLKDRISTTFLYFTENEHRLGPEPARQLAVLREFIRRR